MPFTAPQEALAVMVAKSEVAEMPKRASLPSMLPPGWSRLAAISSPTGLRAGLACCSKWPTPTAQLKKEHRHDTPEHPSLSVVARKVTKGPA